MNYSQLTVLYEMKPLQNETKRNHCETKPNETIVKQSHCKMKPNETIAK